MVFRMKIIRIFMSVSALVIILTHICISETAEQEKIQKNVSYKSGYTEDVEELLVNEKIENISEQTIILKDNEIEKAMAELSEVLSKDDSSIIDIQTALSRFIPAGVKYVTAPVNQLIATTISVFKNLKMVISAELINNSNNEDSD